MLLLHVVVQRKYIVLAVAKQRMSEGRPGRDKNNGQKIITGSNGN